MAVAAGDGFWLISDEEYDEMILDGGLEHFSPARLDRDRVVTVSSSESRYVARVVEQIRPQLTIWSHQPLGVVDDSGGRRALARRNARLVGLSLVRPPCYARSAANWHHLYPNTSLVVELPPRPLTRTSAARYGDAVLDFLGPR